MKTKVRRRDVLDLEGQVGNVLGSKTKRKEDQGNGNEQGGDAGKPILMTHELTCGRGESAQRLIRLAFQKKRLKVGISELTFGGPHDGPPFPWRGATSSESV
jgi:hypothetical protein